MIALTSPYLWYVTRATGLVTLVLFTIVVCLGTFVANRVGGTNVGRFELNELHRSVSMTAMAFLVLHILSTILDSYVPTGWLSAVIPMTSSYKRFDVALGAVAFDLMLAVWASSLMKARIATDRGDSSTGSPGWRSWPRPRTLSSSAPTLARASSRGRHQLCARRRRHRSVALPEAAHARVGPNGTVAPRAARAPRDTKNARRNPPAKSSAAM